MGRCEDFLFVRTYTNKMAHVCTIREYVQTHRVGQATRTLHGENTTHPSLLQGVSPSTFHSSPASAKGIPHLQTTQ